MAYDWGSRSMPDGTLIALKEFGALFAQKRLLEER